MRIFPIFLFLIIFTSCSQDKNEFQYPEPDGTNDSDSIETDDKIMPEEDPDANDPDAGTDQNDDETDIDENDSDTETITTDHDFTNDPCVPNPCVMEYSDGKCYFAGEKFKCGCDDGYFWDGLGCSQDPCAEDPCSDVENSDGTCEIDENTYKCICLEDYYWDGSECLEIPDIVYVDASATGLNDGTSWENAFEDFTDALQSVNNTDIEKWIWVAEGIYKPRETFRQSFCTVEESKCFNFSLISKVSIICGFFGNETKLEQRDWENNESIFSGDMDDDGTFSEADTFNLFFNVDIDDSAVIDGCYIEGGNASLEDGTVIDSHMKHGGGMHNVSNAHPTIRNTTFRYNSAYIQGGGMMNGEGSNPTIINCHFENNESFKGAALSNTLSSPTIINSTFINNIAFEGYGGAIFNLEESSPQFTDCTFIGNEADDGGAALNSDRSDASFTNCVFTNNTATRNGGAVGVAYQSGGTYENCLFDSNTSIAGGGAIEIYYESETRIINSIFINNSVQGNGDGGALLITDSFPEIINSLFIGNSAVNGGAIANRNSEPDILNNTICYNSASTFGGGIQNETSTTAYITNTIIFYNSAESERDNISNESADALFYSCDIEGSSSDGTWNFKYGSDEGGNMAVAPMFTNIADGDFTLSKDSLCIDAGSNAPYEEGEYAQDIKFDLLGHDRIIDGTVDMGAYESLFLPEGLYRSNFLIKDVYALSRSSPFFEHSERYLSSGSRQSLDVMLFSAPSTTKR